MRKKSVLSLAAGATKNELENSLRDDVDEKDTTIVYT